MGVIYIFFEMASTTDFRFKQVRFMQDFRLMEDFNSSLNEKID